MEVPFKDERYKKVERIVSMVDCFGFECSVVFLETEPSKLAEIVSRYRIAIAARLERFKSVQYDGPEVLKQIAAVWRRPEDGWDHIYALVDQMEREAATRKSRRLKQKCLRFTSVALVSILLFSISLSMSSYMF